MTPKKPSQLDAEIDEALSAPEWLVSLHRERVDPKSYGALIKKAVKFPEFKSPSKYTWDLVRGVPIHDLDPGSRFDYEVDPDSDAKEVRQNLRRYDQVEGLIVYQHQEPWPIVIDQHGGVIDGNHRLSVLADHGVEEVDVLWVRPKSKQR